MSGRLILSKGPNKEALSLYRDILRASRHFHWADKEGEPWCAIHSSASAAHERMNESRRRRRNVVLRASARKEFEQARDEPARPAASARH